MFMKMWRVDGGGVGSRFFVSTDEARLTSMLQVKLPNKNISGKLVKRGLI